MSAQETFLDDPLYIGPSPVTLSLSYYVLHNITMYIYLVVDLYTFTLSFSLTKIKSLLHEGRYCKQILYCCFKLRAIEQGKVLHKYL